jgi:hypothetical protein
MAAPQRSRATHPGCACRQTGEILQRIPVDCLDHRQPRLLTQIKADCAYSAINCIMDWNPINSAPFERDIELAVLDQSGEHLVAFACRRGVDGWLTARSNRPVDIHPTHWRQWTEKSETVAPVPKKEPVRDAVTAHDASLKPACAEDVTTALTPDEEVRLLHILE